MSESNHRVVSLTSVLTIVGGLAAFGVFALSIVVSDQAKHEKRLHELELKFGVWTERVLPMDAVQSMTNNETDRIIEIMWNRLFPGEKYPRMRTPPPAVQP